MGLFSKEKITIDQLTENHVNLIFRSISDDSLEVYKMLLKNMNENEVIDKRQKREILVLEMLATTRVIQKVFTDVKESKILLDKLYAKIYDKFSESEKEQSEFEEFVNERYKVYYKILTSDSMFSLGIGKQFADYFLNKDVTSLAFINAITDIFISNIKLGQEFLEGLLSKYELEK